MKLLVLTQAVDEDNEVLAFFLDWIRAFALRSDLVTVICLYRGKAELPANVQVLSLGKESGRSRLKYLINFYRFIWRERKNYDRVFIHMNPVYAVLGGPVWRLFGKKIGLWFVHRQPNLMLRLAEKSVDRVFTASAEGFTLPSKKKLILGHGVDTARFSPAAGRPADGKYKIIYVGRLSRIKNQDVLIEAMNIMVNQKQVREISAELIGTPIRAEDGAYAASLKVQVKKYGLEKYVSFAGSIPNRLISASYQAADLSVNLSPTGGMDKAVLESIACGLPVIVYNKAFAGLIKDEAGPMQLEELKPERLAEKIAGFMADRQRLAAIAGRLRQTVLKDYSLDHLIASIIAAFEK